VGAIAPRLSITKFEASMLVDVVSSVVGPSIVDETLLDRHGLLALRWWLLVNPLFPLVLSRLRVLFRGRPSTSRS